MLKLKLSYKSTISWRMLFRPRGIPSKVSRLKLFRALVVPSGGSHKEINMQGILTPTVVLPNEQSFLRRKGYVMVASVHSPINRNSAHAQMAIWHIYNTRWSEHPHPTIRWYQ